MAWLMVSSRKKLQSSFKLSFSQLGSSLTYESLTYESEPCFICCYTEKERLASFMKSIVCQADLVQPGLSF